MKIYCTYCETATERGDHDVCRECGRAPGSKDDGGWTGTGFSLTPLPLSRVLLSKSKESHMWEITINPRWDHFSRAASSILDNEFNEYVEYVNSGVQHRMIRAMDWSKYGEGELATAWTLELRNKDIP